MAGDKTCFPSTNTFPSKMSLSASLLEQDPDLAILLASLSSGKGITRFSKTLIFFCSTKALFRISSTWVVSVVVLCATELAQRK